MTKWLRAKQNLESLLIMPNIISFIESDNFEFSMREAQSRNSFQNNVSCVLSDKKGSQSGEVTVLLTDSFSIKSGVKQDCVLAPTRFWFSFSLLLSHAFHSSTDGVYLFTRTDGKLFNVARLRAKTKVKTILVDMLFADDAALATQIRDSNAEAHQQILLRDVKTLASQSASRRPMRVPRM